MKPNIGIVFPGIKNPEMAEKSIQKIKISRHRRKMEVFLEEEAAQEAVQKLEEQLGGGTGFPAYMW